MNLKLGKVLEITPTNESGPPVPMFARAKTSIIAGTPTIPVEPGTLIVRTGASVRWEIAP